MSSAGGPAPRGSSGSRVEPARELSDVANEVIAVAAEVGRADLRERITEDASRWSERHARVLCVGPPGDAALVLAGILTGRDDVLGTDGARSGGDLSITMSIAASGVDRAVLHVPDGQARQLAVSEVPRALFSGWSGGHLELELATARLDSLVRLTVCPAWGGSVDREGLTARLLARSADLVIVVADLTAPLSATDRDVVRVILADRSEAFLVGLGIERLRGWREVLRDSMDSLRQGVSSRITGFGVSAALTAQAFDPELADEHSTVFLELSGLGEIQIAIASLLDDLRRVRMSNLASTLAGVVGELEQTSRDMLDATEREATEVVERLTTLKDDLSRAREDRASWMLMLGDQMTMVRDESTADLQRTLSDLGGRLERLAHEHRGEADPFRERVAADVDSAVSGVAARLAERLDSVVASLAGHTELNELGVALDPIDLGALVAAAVDEDPARRAATPSQSKLRTAGSMVTMGTSLTMAASAGDDMLRLAAFGAATLLAGVTTVFSVGSGRRDRSRQQLIAELRAQLEPLRLSGPPQMRAYLLRVQRGIEVVLKEEIRRRSTQIERRIAELQQTERAESTERRRIAAVQRTRLARLGAVTLRLDVVIDGLAPSDDDHSTVAR